VSGLTGATLPGSGRRGAGGSDERAGNGARVRFPAAQRPAAELQSSVFPGLREQFGAEHAISAWIAGLLTAGGLTAALGVGLPAILYPESNLEPIVGFILALPAAILGAVLGAIVQRYVKSYSGSCLLGALVGVGVAIGLVVGFSTPESPAGKGAIATYVGLGVFIFGTTAVIARKSSASKS